MRSIEWCHLQWSWTTSNPDFKVMPLFDAEYIFEKLYILYIHTGQALQYLSNCVSTISSFGNRYRLRSCDTADYILPRTRTKFGERGFHYSGPAAWNTAMTYMKLLTLMYSRNDLKLFCSIVRTDLLLLYGAPGRFVVRRLTNISLYLYLYLRYTRSYNGILTATYTCPTQKCNFEWPSVALRDFAKQSMRCTYNHRGVRTNISQ